MKFYILFGILIVVIIINASFNKVVQFFNLEEDNYRGYLSFINIILLFSIFLKDKRGGIVDRLIAINKN